MDLNGTAAATAAHNGSSPALLPGEEPPFDMEAT
jgi:hypothetical protein